MANELSSGNLYFDDIIASAVDPENLTSKWFWTRTPYPVLTVLVAYLAVVKLGPDLMTSRPAYDFKHVMRLYNLLQMVMNASFIYAFFSHPNGISTFSSTACSIEGHEAIGELKQVFLLYMWRYLMLKVADLLDTIFMVLRKKNSHITFLHVYHHTGMVFFTWFTLTYIKSHHAVLPGLINVTVHTIMYAYYFLATFPRLKRYLWWKQHLTKLQLGQFAVILLYMSTLYYKGCQISRMFNVIWIINVSVIFMFFINFYVNTYVLQPSERPYDRSSSKNA